MRRSRAAFALVLALALVGCSSSNGLLPGPADTETSVPDDASTISPVESTTPTVSPTPSAPGSTDGRDSDGSSSADRLASYPPGYGPDGVTETATAADAHTRALLGHTSYEMAYNATVVAPNGTAVVESLTRVETDAPRWSVRTAVTDIGSQHRYYENGTLYAKNAPAEGNVTYARRSVNLPLQTVTGRRFVVPALANISWRNATRVTLDGVAAYRYTATNLTATRLLLAPSVAPESVTAFEATLLVDADGLIRRVTYHATVEHGDETREYEVSLRVGELDATAVERPAWVENREN